MKEGITDSHLQPKNKERSFETWRTVDYIGRGYVLQERVRVHTEGYVTERTEPVLEYDGHEKTVTRKEGGFGKRGLDIREYDETVFERVDGRIQQRVVHIADVEGIDTSAMKQRVVDEDLS